MCKMVAQAYCPCPYMVRDRNHTKNVQMSYCKDHRCSLSESKSFRKALLNRNFHITQISHRVMNWYQNVTFGKCEAYGQL